jgi:hypothetical protein
MITGAFCDPQKDSIIASLRTPLHGVANWEMNGVVGDDMVCRRRKGQESLVRYK